jgi:saccharopine dehydrogenase-like NADP-dependent oxidoreductase
VGDEKQLAALVAATGGRVIVDGTDVVEMTETLLRAGYTLESAASIAVSSVGADPGLAEAIVARFEARARETLDFEAGQTSEDVSPDGWDLLEAETA